MGLSRRAYAAHRKARGLSGGTDAAVRKALATGRISLEPDGTIDPKRADRDWEIATNPSQQRGEAAIAQGVEAARETKEADEHKPVPTAAVNAVNEAAEELGAGQGVSYAKARAVNEILKAQRAKLLLKKLNGELVDRKAAEAHVFDLARKERDAWLQLPARVAATMAAELGVDAHVMEQVLDRYVRDHLATLAGVKIDLGS